MKYTVQKNKDAYYDYKYAIGIKNILEFHAARSWLSHTYGFTEPILSGVKSEYWAFSMIYQVYTIFLKGDEELSWFNIKFGSSQ